MAIYAKRLLSDPYPRRFGVTVPGVLTKKEFRKVEEVLSRALNGRYQQQDLSLWEKKSLDWSEDEHTAFGSLLHGGYIRETHSGSGRYGTTTAGAEYAVQLGVEPAKARRR